MDSLTHIAIGACTGEILLGRKIGRSAMIWGALAQSVPDIDFVAAMWMNPADLLLAHRGFTHSLLFGMAITFLFALVAERWHRPHNITMRHWLLFFGISVFGHLFIDAFNNYGVGWWEPFSHARVSFNALYVADPFFSIAPGIMVVILIFSKKTYRNRRRLAAWGLLLPALYMSYALWNKSFIDAEVERMANRQQLNYTGYITMPTPLNNWLWYVVLRSDSGYYIAHLSVFDPKDSLRLSWFPQNRHLLDTVSDHEGLQKLIRFSRGYYTAEHWGDTLVFNDLRFGQETGWYTPKGRFAFHYFLSHPNDNHLVVQRGRFAGWNSPAMASLLRRIAGER